MHEQDHQSQLSGFQILRRKKGKMRGGKIFREKKGLRRTFTRCIKGTPRTLVYFIACEDEECRVSQIVPIT